MQGTIERRTIERHYHPNHIGNITRQSQPHNYMPEKASMFSSEHFDKFLMELVTDLQAMVSIAQSIYTIRQTMVAKDELG